MKRIIIDPSGEERKDLIRDVVTDLVLGVFALFSLFLLSGSYLRYLMGYPLLQPINLLLAMLGVGTLASMIRIHREAAMPGEGVFWMTHRTPVGWVLQCIVYGYALFLMAVAFDLPPFRRIPGWVSELIHPLL